MSSTNANQNLRIGVFGSAFHLEEAAVSYAKRIGHGIAQRGHILISGATSGLPYIAGKAAIDAGGVVLGISPARNPTEHTNFYNKPLDGCSYIFYTGQGYTGRNYLNLRNCHLAVFIGGEAGTLEEFCIGVYEGLVLGVLTSSGGICELLPEIVKRFQTSHGEITCFEDVPEVLLDKILTIYTDRLRL